MSVVRTRYMCILSRRRFRHRLLIFAGTEGKLHSGNLVLLQTVHEALHYGVVPRSLLGEVVLNVMAHTMWWLSSYDADDDDDDADDDDDDDDDDNLI